MIEVKNYGTRSVTLAVNGSLIMIKPGQCTHLDEKLYESYIKIFPSLRPVTEYAIIEADTEEIEQPAPKKTASKGKKRK